MKVTFLDEKHLSETDLVRMGGKASSLARLLMAGFPVPQAFVLSEEVTDLDEKIKKIGGFPVAVRSSGSMEDLANASFAGLYETFLNIQNMEELYSSIKKCFDSRNSDRVRDYLETKKIEWTPETLNMSVVVQKMVEPAMAGVLFTLNPMNGFEEEMYLELCEGIGERLVSGHVTPTQITFNWIENRKVSETINTEGTKISDGQLDQLIKVAGEIQAYYGSPQDIEWAIDHNGKVFILQSRPVTTFFPRTDTPELTNADFKDGGVSARVCTPLMFSLYRDALKLSMGEYFKKINLISNDEKIQWIYYHYGRVYWNAGAVKEGLKKIPGYKEDDFDRDLGVQKDYGDQGPDSTPLSLSTLVNAVPVLLGLNKEYMDCLNMIDHFRERFERQDEELKSRMTDLSKMDVLQFKTWFLDALQFQNETEKNYFRTIYNNSNFQSEYKSFIKKLPAYQEGDEIDLMSELHGVAHLDVQSALGRLRSVADFYGFFSDTYYSAREEFLKHHYHHGPAELELMTPRWGEKKEWVDEFVKNYLPGIHQSRNKFQKTFARIADGLGPFKRRSFMKQTEKSRQFLRLREEMRSYSTRAYYLVRQGALEFGKRAGWEEVNTFMLDVQEIKSYLLRSDC
ncbi:MAG: PEP/pyruvate-binding domain-containing protein, partial [Bacteriovoracia bacterium]